MEIPLLHLKILIFLQMNDGSEDVEFSRKSRIGQSHIYISDIRIILKFFFFFKQAKGKQKCYFVSSIKYAVPGNQAQNF